MIGAIPSCALSGVQGYRVTVEVDVAEGKLPAYGLVGLPAASVREAAVRIRSSLQQIGSGMPRKKITVNLAPADRRKDGAAFDLPIAIAILLGDGQIEPKAVSDLLMMGELGLDGSLRPIKGVLAAALLAKKQGLRGIIVPYESAFEAAEISDIAVYGARHLSEVLRALRGETELECINDRVLDGPVAAQPVLDMSDVRGQELARFALEVAVAGGHNILLLGAPGIGKTMLARRLPTILPPLDRDERLETTLIYSSVGLATAGLIRERPFRSPHHTITTAALVGGGRPARAGEVSLAHNGVLFLDELPEFSRQSLEALRQPLEDREVTIGRVHGSWRFPASFMLAASANPCPCGWLGSGVRTCTCSSGSLNRYRQRLSGPLLDRIDLQVAVRPVTLAEMRHSQAGESSSRIRERVMEARQRQAARLDPHGLRSNAEMTARILQRCCTLTARAEKELERLVTRRGTISGRGIHRIIKVARTIADLAGRDDIEVDDVREAINYRAFDVVQRECAPLRSTPGPVAEQDAGSPSPKNDEAAAEAATSH